MNNEKNRKIATNTCLLQSVVKLENIPGSQFNFPFPHSV